MQLDSAVPALPGCALWQATTPVVSALVIYCDLSGQIKMLWHTCLGLIYLADKTCVYFSWENNRLDELAEDRLQAVYPQKDSDELTDVPQHIAR